MEGRMVLHDCGLATFSGAEKAFGYCSSHAKFNIINRNCPVVDDELKCFSSPGENATLKLLLVSANVTISWNRYGMYR